MVWHHRSAAEIRKDHDALHEQFQRQTVLPLGATLIIIAYVPWALVGHPVVRLAINFSAAGVGLVGQHALS